MPGETLPEPESDTELPSIDALVALLLVQLNVDELPRRIELGLAVNVPVGAGAGMTLTVAELVACVPTIFVSVRV